MTTDEEKAKIAKLLRGIEVPDVKLTERCSDIIKEFHQKFNKEDKEDEEIEESTELYKNPYKVDPNLLEENERKLQALLADCKRTKRDMSKCGIISGADPKRPWRTHSNKEKLLRIDNELQRHQQRTNDMIAPMTILEMKELVKECEEESQSAPSITTERIRNTIEEAIKNLPNFKYRSGQYIPRPKTKQCFLRSLGELRNLRVLALEYSHIADGTGGALMALMPVIKKPHFRLQIICRENQTPGRSDAALGVAGYDIPDTVWKRVAVACPDVYILMTFFRIRDYDNVRRFLTPSIPIRETHLELGIDLKMRQRQDSDISCFIRHVAHHYCSSLVTLSIHQWRFATFPLRRVFELMPRLVRFFYIGRVEDEVDLRRMLQIVAGGVCDRLKQIKLQIQDDESKRNYWQNTVDTLCKEYKDIMQLFEIDFCIGIYKN